MSDMPPNASAQAMPAHAHFPVARVFYALGFAFLAWVVLWILFVLALVQFVVLAINGQVNEELKNISASLVQYLWELLAFVVFVRDERPFPFSPFPKTI
jgi:hypothetical protein